MAESLQNDGRIEEIFEGDDSTRIQTKLDEDLHVTYTRRHFEAIRIESMSQLKM